MLSMGVFSAFMLLLLLVCIHFIDYNYLLILLILSQESYGCDSN